MNDWFKNLRVVLVYSRVHAKKSAQETYGVATVNVSQALDQLADVSSPVSTLAASRAGV